MELDNKYVHFRHVPLELEKSIKQRGNWRLIGIGYGIHWEDLDEDIAIADLLSV